MKQITILCLLLILFSTILIGQKNKPVELKTENDKINYIIGLELGLNLLKQEVSLQSDIVLQGVKDGYGNKTALIPLTEIQTVISKFQADQKIKAAETLKKVADKNKIDGAKYLADNGKKSDVTTYPSGVQVKVIRLGTGKTPQLADSIMCHYKGFFVDNAEFANTYKSESAELLGVATLIPGLKECILRMPTGSKYQISIPAEQAYDEKGSGNIGPNAVLIFEFEVLSITSK